ncbi:DeoR/GlpR family DNA-binding transcription regulator [Lysinibacillus antri]|uniref:DeoR/GlpR family DNA-binding transcription regulator n=1 Tax=Lysinibacillus antri TaxID=2498145 RepID=UPI001FE2AC74|nr:DeoR/GlpR family DNA-binding transcription regulator [Lysinibacillus antri]
MTPIERKKKIIELLESKNYVEISNLSTLLKVSEMTVRRDLEKMEAEGLLVRVLGGAKAIQKNIIEDTLLERASENLQAKRLIAKEAVKFIEDGDVIAFDASTSAFELSKLVKGFKNLTVVTNNLSIVLELIDSDVTVILLGGYVRANSLSTMGTSLSMYMNSININKLFISARGLTLSEGLTDSTIDEGEAKQAMINKSNKIIALVDQSKIGLVKFFQICPASEISIVVTDEYKPLSKNQLSMINDLRNVNIEVLIAK